MSGERETGRPPSFLRAAWREQVRIARIRPRAPLRLYVRVAHWFASTVVRESAPHIAIAAAVVCGLLLVLGAVGTTLGVIALALVGLALLWELRLAWLAHRSTAEVEAALEGIESRDATRVPRKHLAVPPLMFVTRRVNRRRGVIFSEADGVRLRLDVYRPADDDPNDDELRPAVIQVHGGGWLAGSRYEQGIPLLNHLASIGWVGFNIDYRLSPEATWPDHIVDVKRAIAWVRENAAELGIDPELICITGGSAGGHLCALAGVTENAPDLQPGFEGADTSLAAAVPFYGVYDMTNSNGFHFPDLRDYVLGRLVFKRPYAGNEELYRSASPLFRMHPRVPPFLVIHGDRDTLVSVDDARFFVERLREVSESAVRYVELPDAEHAFDLWPSERTARIAEGIGRFLTAVVTERSGAAPRHAEPERTARR